MQYRTPTMNAWKNILWRPFEKLEGATFQPSDFSETLDGGQAFTWYKISDNPDGGNYPEFFGTFGKNAARLRLNCEGQVEISVPKTANRKIAISAASKYLDCHRDYTSLRRALSSVADPHMDAALRVYPTLRILRQSPADAIISFICSSSKRIVQIKQCVALLSKNLGEEIYDGVHALPTFERLAEAPIAKISECKLGFRADYLKKSAEKIVADGFDPESLREIPYAEAKSYLLSLRGIGEKVADCILLFGAARFQAFPVDTWIRQAMTKLYSTSASPEAIRRFAADKFGENAGFAQQLIFANIRKK